MERVFSVEGEEIPNPFWAPPQSSPPVVQPQFAAGGGVGGAGLGSVADGGRGGGGAMGSDRTEWGLQKFLEEALLHVDGGGHTPLAPNADDPVLQLRPSPVVAVSSGGGTRLDQDDDDDSDSDLEVLKVIPAPAPAPAPAPPVPASEVTDPVAYNAMLRRKLDEDLAVVALWKASGGGGSGANLVQNEGVNVISSSSGASDDDMEGETSAMENMNDTACKAKRRKESNRDSARRSRSKKAAHLRDMEDQLSDLKVKNNWLLRRLAQVVQKHNNSVVDYRVLSAKIETLETKLKMAENNLMRATDTTNVAQAISALSSLTTPFTGYPPDTNTASGISVPIQDATVSYFAAQATTHHGVHGNSCIPRAASAFQTGDIAAASSQVQPYASMGHLQNTVLGGGPTVAVTQPPWAVPGGFK